MDGVADENDIVVESYGLDIEGIFHFFQEKAFSWDWSGLTHTLEFWWNVYSVIAIIFSLILFVGFVYAKIRYEQLHDIERQQIKDEEARWALKHQSPETKNSRWDVIQLRVAENNPEAWKIAIIEADILLDETLANAGYVGQSIGEKLKSANPHSFTTLQDAWEAHKVRNDIAHVGSDFVLTKKTAQEALVQFGRVFREFGVI